MRPLTTRSLATLAALALLAPLAACGDDDADPGDGDSSAGPSTSTEPAALPAPTTATAADGTTAPGSVLVLGETALVPLGTFGDPPAGTVNATVTSIEATDGEVPDWADDGDVVYRIDATLEVVTWVDGERAAADPWLNGLVGDAPLGKADPTIYAEIGCESPGLGSREEPGATYEVCVTAVGPADAPVVAAWSMSGSDYGLDGGSPLLWRP